MSTTSTLKKLAGKAAPFIGSMIGGPLGATAGKVLGDFLLGDEGASEKDIAQALTMMTPEQTVALKKLDADYKIKMAELGIDEQKIVMMDRDSAREREVRAGDKTPAILAYLLTLGFFGLLASLIFYPVQDGAKDIIQIMVGSLGTAWISCIAYFFGSSAGSKLKTLIMK